MKSVDKKRKRSPPKEMEVLQNYNINDNSAESNLKLLLQVIEDLPLKEPNRKVLKKHIQQFIESKDLEVILVVDENTLENEISQSQVIPDIKSETMITEKTQEEYQEESQDEIPTKYQEEYQEESQEESQNENPKKIPKKIPKKTQNDISQKSKVKLQKEPQEKYQEESQNENPKKIPKKITKKSQNDIPTKITKTSSKKIAKKSQNEIPQKSKVKLQKEPQEESQEESQNESPKKIPKKSQNEIPQKSLTETTTQGNHQKCRFTEINTKTHCVYYLKMNRENDINFTLLQKWADLFSHSEFKNCAEIKILEKHEKSLNTFQTFQENLINVVKLHFEELYYDEYINEKSKSFAFLINNNSFQTAIDKSTKKLFPQLQCQNEFNLAKNEKEQQFIDPQCFTFLHGRNRYFLIIFLNQMFHQMFQQQTTQDIFMED